MATNQDNSDLVEYVMENSTKCSAPHKDKGPKVCGVCGDVARSMHFGAICCDSCKAFFRRSIQNSMWETFICVRDGECEVTENRRCCQACRFSLCRKIGMDPTLVMSEEDRKLLMSRRLERKRQQLLEHHRQKQQNLEKQFQQECRTENQPESSSVQSGNRDEEMEETTDMPLSSFEIKEEFKVEEMEEDTMEEAGFTSMTVDQVTLKPDNLEGMAESRLHREDLEKIVHLQKLLRKGLTFPEFPRHYYEEDTDVTEHLFFVFCKGMGNFFSLIPEFRALQAEDRSMLLKDAVSKAIFIFGAHQFQENHEYWPRKLLSTSCTFPKVTMAAVERFLGDQDVIYKLKDFMRRFRQFFDDEVVMLLSLMVAVLDQNDSVSPIGLDISERQNKYLTLLEDYLHDSDTTVPTSLVISELWTCLREVDELVQCLRRTSSKDKANAQRPEEGTFASSLHTLGGDSRLPPKKAFNKKVKIDGERGASDVVFLKEVQNADTWQEMSYTCLSPSSAATCNDHDYLKLSGHSSGDSFSGAHFPTAQNILRTKELEIIPLPPGSQPRTATKVAPVRGHLSGCPRKPVALGVSFPLSEEVDLIKPVTSSLSMRRMPSPPLQTFPFRGVNPQSEVRSSKEHLTQMIPEMYQDSVDRCFLPYEVQQTHHPHFEAARESSHLTEKYPVDRGISHNVGPYDRHDEVRPSSASSSSSCSSSSSSRQSPMTRVCHGLRRLSAQDDQQILQAVQGVLPPRLVTHLANRLVSVRRAQDE